MLFIGRFILILFPFTYMFLIWQQTSYFDPESVSSLSSVLSDAVILSIGVTLELAHLFEFGILYFLIILALLCYGYLSKRKEILALVISLLYGFSDEIHQLYVPFRSFSILDIIKNTIGVLATWYFIHQKYFTKTDSRVGSILRKITTIFKKEKTNVSI